MKFTTLLLAVLFSFSTFAAGTMIKDSREALDVVLGDFTTNHTQAVDLVHAYKVWNFGGNFGVRIYLADGTKMEWNCHKSDSMKCEWIKETEAPAPTETTHETPAPTPGV
jgi:hypothetical protein